MDKIYCGNCGFENRIENNFCNQCGVNIQRAQNEDKKISSTSSEFDYDLLRSRLYNLLELSGYFTIANNNQYIQFSKDSDNNNVYVGLLDIDKLSTEKLNFLKTVKFDIAGNNAFRSFEILKDNTEIEDIIEVVKNILNDVYILYSNESFVFDENYLVKNNIKESIQNGGDSIKKGKNFWKFGTIIAAIYFAFRAFNLYEGERSNETSTNFQTESYSTTYKIGEEIRVGNFVYKVNNIGWNKSLGGEYFREHADGFFLIVDVDLKNMDKEERTLDNSFFYLTDSNGKKYESSAEATTALEMNGEKTLFLKQCNPNIQKHGLLCFEVPEKDIYDLHLSGGFLNGETAIVTLDNTK